MGEPITHEEFRAKFAGQQPPDAWLEDAEDAEDVAASNEALADPVRIPHEQAMRELGW